MPGPIQLNVGQCDAISMSFAFLLGQRNPGSQTLRPALLHGHQMFHGPPGSALRPPKAEVRPLPYQRRLPLSRLGAATHPSTSSFPPAKQLGTYSKREGPACHLQRREGEVFVSEGVGQRHGGGGGYNTGCPVWQTTSHPEAMGRLFGPDISVCSGMTAMPHGLP